MVNRKKVFDLKTTSDVDVLIHAALDESDGEDFLDVFNDTDDVADLSVREGDSESEIGYKSTDSGEEEDESISKTDYFKAIQKKNNKITNLY